MHHFVSFVHLAKREFLPSFYGINYKSVANLLQELFEIYIIQSNASSPVKSLVTTTAKFIRFIRPKDTFGNVNSN